MCVLDWKWPSHPLSSPPSPVDLAVICTEVFVDQDSHSPTRLFSQVLPLLQCQIGGMALLKKKSQVAKWAFPLSFGFTSPFGLALVLCWGRWYFWYLGKYGGREDLLCSLAIDETNRALMGEFSGWVIMPGSFLDQTDQSHVGVFSLLCWTCGHPLKNMHSDGDFSRVHWRCNT